MSVKKSATITCDACGKEEPLDGFRGKWLQVQSMVSTSGELMELMDRMGVSRSGDGPVSEEDMKKVVDAGDFCSMRCLGNWASSTEALRSLDEELENGSFMDLGDGGDEPTPTPV